MLHSLKNSWWLILIALALYAILPLVTRIPGYEALTNDYKGLGPLYFYFPMLNVLVGAVGALRYGFSLYRTVLTALLVAVPMMVHYGGPVQWDAVPVLALAYAVFGLVGEGAGSAIRAILTRRKAA